MCVKQASTSQLGVHVCKSQLHGTFGNMPDLCIQLRSELSSKVDPVVPKYPLILNPYKSIQKTVQNTFKTEAHSSDPFREGKGPYYGLIGQL